MVTPPNYGVPVYTQTGGQVVNVQNYRSGDPLYWEVAILDPEGYVWQFHHIDHTTIPQEIHDAYQAYLNDPDTGGSVEPGTWIGDIVEWPVESFGYFSIISISTFLPRVISTSIRLNSTNMGTTWTRKTRSFTKSDF